MKLSFTSPLSSLNISGVISQISVVFGRAAAVLSPHQFLLFMLARWEHSFLSFSLTTTRVFTNTHFTLTKRFRVFSPAVSFEQKGFRSGRLITSLVTKPKGKFVRDLGEKRGQT